MKFNRIKRYRPVIINVPKTKKRSSNIFNEFGIATLHFVHKPACHFNVEQKIYTKEKHLDPTQFQLPEIAQAAQIFDFFDP